MKLILARKDLQAERTIGELRTEGGDFLGYTMEDTVRPAGEKVPGKTAIPAGTYEVTITFSDRFKRPLPLLLNVPMFTGIRIHPGNTEVDTEGCILVGKHREGDRITESRIACAEVQGMIEVALKSEKVWIEIHRSFSGR